jgi:hypothetical protein
MTITSDKPKASTNLTDFKAANYGIKIVHNRRYKVAYLEPITGKLIVKVIVNDTQSMTPNGLNSNWVRKPNQSDLCFSQLLAKGGVTEITVTDPETKTDFYAKAICREDENYNKAYGVEKCLSRVFDLMLVCDGKDDFTMKIK